MTDRLRQRRRYGIHVPQLVGRLSAPKHADEDHQGKEAYQSLLRIPGEFDGAMQELQRYLRYLQTANDEAVVAGAFFEGTPTLVSGLAGDPGDPAVGWIPGDHSHQALVGSPVGLGNASALGAGPALAYNDHVHKRDVRVAFNGVDVGTRNRINFTTSGAVPTDDPGNDEVDVPLASALAVQESTALALLAIMGFQELHDGA